MKRLLIIFFVFSFFLVSFDAYSQQEEQNYGIHNVQAGENLYRISRTYFLKEQDIIDVNPGLSAETLKAGQVIKIPYTVRNKSLLNQVNSSTILTDFSQQTTSSNNNNNTKPVTYTKPKKYNSKKHLNIAMMLPLAYDKIDQLNFTKFNIEEKKKAKYQSFEYITFFEGARIALDKLEKEGYSVSLRVFDVAEEDTKGMQDALNSESMKDMDLIIPLVFQKNFNIALEYANANKIPIINPMSSNLTILNNNPYLFKIQPSPAAEVETIIRYIRNNFSNPNIILLYTPSASEKPIMEYYKQIFEKGGFSWCIVDYNKYAGRIFEKIDNSKDNIYISIVDKGNPKLNEAYVTQLLSKLNSNKKLPNINLIGQYSWLDFPNIDLTLMQKFNYHFTLSYLNDYTNVNFVNFVKDFRTHFKAEPDKIYAALGYDIMMYFVPGMTQKGDDFINEPNHDNTKTMVNSYYFERRNDSTGYQNKRTVIYKLNDYKIISVGR